MSNFPKNVQLVHYIARDTQFPLEMPIHFCISISLILFQTLTISLSNYYSGPSRQKKRRKKKGGREKVLEILFFPCSSCRTCLNYILKTLLLYDTVPTHTHKIDDSHCQQNIGQISSLDIQGSNTLSLSTNLVFPISWTSYPRPQHRLCTESLLSYVH